MKISPWSFVELNKTNVTEHKRSERAANEEIKSEISPISVHIDHDENGDLNGTEQLKGMQFNPTQKPLPVALLDDIVEYNFQLLSEQDVKQRRLPEEHLPAIQLVVSFSLFMAIHIIVHCPVGTMAGDYPGKWMVNGSEVRDDVIHAGLTP